MQKFYFAIFTFFILWPAPALTEWRPFGGPPIRDAAVDLDTSDGNPLVLMAHNLLVFDGDSPRRAFTLNAQNDALVDAVHQGETIVLASRRTIWRSADRGFSWRKLISLTPRDPDEWLAVSLAAEGSILAAARSGLKLVSPGSAAAAELLGRGRIESAHRYGSTLLLQTAQGVFAVDSQSPAELQKLAISPTGPLRAYARLDGEHWSADPQSVMRCDHTHCLTEANLAGITAIAAVHDAYWLASTDAVWRRNNEGESWQRATDGLGAARPVALRAAEGRLFALTDRGLFTWFTPASAATAKNLRLPAARPSMAEVRRMVLAAIGELGAGQVTDWRGRARWRAAAPLVGLSVRRNHDDRTGQTLGNTIALSTADNRILIGPDGQSTTRASARGLDYGISLTWSLDDLVFNSQELSVSNEVEDLFRLRESVLLDVTRLYYDRLRTLAQFHRETEPVRRIELELRAAELAAEIDFYTDGRFSRALADEDGR